MTDFRRVQEQIDRLREWYDHPPKKFIEIADTMQALLDVASAAVPFSHDDLCAYLGGNSEGEDSIVFQRNSAYLRLRDFRGIRSGLAKLQEQNDA